MSRPPPEAMSTHSRLATASTASGRSVPPTTIARATNAAVPSSISAPAPRKEATATVTASRWTPAPRSRSARGGTSAPRTPASSPSSPAYPNQVRRSS
ncbi:hypothetical protein [Georgenia sp. SUBG003]|uniref:hypothetical protein n=1 Tax=Georgenia sp. SUBG003 TaxID=1497974 RepID=UPI003AB67AED